MKKSFRPITLQEFTFALSVLKRAIDAKQIHYKDGDTKVREVTSLIAMQFAGSSGGKSLFCGPEWILFTDPEMATGERKIELKKLLDEKEFSIKDTLDSINELKKELESL